MNSFKNRLHKHWAENSEENSEKFLRLNWYKSWMPCIIQGCTNSSRPAFCWKSCLPPSILSSPFIIISTPFNPVFTLSSCLPALLSCLPPFSECCEWMLHEKPQASILLEVDLSVSTESSYLLLLLPLWTMCKQCVNMKWVNKVKNV